ncbi:MAG: hypothetical protein FJX77_04005 [Armatimonadetes bacterium]|nr:hypothetical protein [Armatimonadota bacterium]
MIRTHFVFLGEDRVQMEQRLPLVTRSLRLMAPAYYSLDGGEGPGNYGLNKRCLVTILLARESRVTANFALTQPGIADAPKVLAEMAKLAGAPEPPQVEALQQQRRNRLAADPAVRTDQRRGGDRPDLANLNLETADGMRAALRALIAEVQSLRAELAALRGERGTRRDAPEAKRDQPRRELPGAAPTDERLISLLRSFIQPTNTDAAVDRVLGETEQYVKGNPDLTKQAINGWVRVLAIPYGTPYAQKAGQTFVEKLKKGL